MKGPLSTPRDNNSSKHEPEYSSLSLRKSTTLDLTFSADYQGIFEKPNNIANHTTSDFWRTSIEPKKKELKTHRIESEVWTADSSQHETNTQSLIAMRESRRSQPCNDQVRRLKNHIQSIEHSCRMYQSTICALQAKISELTRDLHGSKIQNNSLKSTLESRTQQLNHKISLMEKENKRQYQIIKDRVNTVMEMYNKLESEANQAQIEWSIWKDRWGCEKKLYLSKIAELEGQFRGLEKPVKVKQSFQSELHQEMEKLGFSIRTENENKRINAQNKSSRTERKKSPRSSNEKNYFIGENF